MQHAMRVLFVCTANIARSRRAEEVFRLLVLSAPTRPAHEARSAGTRAWEGARQLRGVDLEWADLVCVMELEHRAFIENQWPEMLPKVRVLGIPDVYAPADARLTELLGSHILELLAELGPPPGADRPDADRPDADWPHAPGRRSPDA